MFRKLAVVAALLSVLAVASRSRAAVEQVSVRIDGLVCPFCAYNVEKRVKTLDGVERDARIVTSVENGTATFPWRAEVVFDPEAVRKAIRQAGFTPREISVTMTGTVEVGSSSKPSLRVVDERANLVLSVPRPDRTDRRESWEELQALANKTTGKLPVRLEGELRSEIAAGSFEVVLRQWAPLAFGAELMAEVEDLAGEQCSTRTMRALGELDGVIHVEANHETDRVHIWTEGKSPDLSVFRERIEALGFKVTHIHQLGAEGVEVQDE